MRRDAQIVGYYTLAAGAARRAELPPKLARNIPDPTPLMLLARLAVDRSRQGSGLGAGLLRDALKRVLAAQTIIGARAVLVHAIDPQAAAFYGKYGFVEFPSGSRTMFLPIETIARAL